MDSMNNYEHGLDNHKLFHKIEKMKEQNFKAQAREVTEHWRKHVPVYGWMQVNYPSGIQLPLREKYENDIILNQQKKQQEEEAKKQIEANIAKQQEESAQSPPMKFKNKSKYRSNPDLVNEDIMKEIQTLVPIDHSVKFLHNYPKNDFGFIKQHFKEFDLQKKNYDIDPDVPHNYAHIRSDDDNQFLYQLGKKNAFTYLTTMDHNKKCEFIDMNLLYESKYCTMEPKSAMLGPEPDPNYQQYAKKIGDISFEEVKGELESVKNLTRLPPENITEEWLKENLNQNVRKLNVENCYWLTKDLISKIGRLDPNLIKISLRNLDISNFIVENIISHAHLIEELNLSNCTGLTKGLCEIISEKGKNIKELNVFNLNTSVNDLGLNYIGRSLLKLKSINLGLCREISDKGFSDLLVNKPEIEDITLIGNRKLTNDSIQLLIETCNKTLKKVTMNYLPFIDEPGIVPFNKCLELTNIEIIGIKSQGENLGDCLTGLGNLHSINFSGYPKLNDNAVVSFIDANKKLRILRVSNCIALTNGLLESISENRTSLLLLEINRTPLITEKAIEVCVEKKAPNLRIIRSTNLVWSKDNLGLLIPYPSDLYQKPSIKGAKKAPVKKNDDKNPENQLIKLREEMKPKFIYEFYKPEGDKKKGGKGKKK